MAKYKKYDYNQTVLLPIALSDQLQPGTLEFYINMIVEEMIDLSVFDPKDITIDAYQIRTGIRIYF